MGCAIVRSAYTQCMQFWWWWRWSENQWIAVLCLSQPKQRQQQTNGCQPLTQCMRSIWILSLANMCEIRHFIILAANRLELRRTRGCQANENRDDRQQSRLWNDIVHHHIDVEFKVSSVLCAPIILNSLLVGNMKSIGLQSIQAHRFFCCFFL